MRVKLPQVWLLIIKIYSNKTRVTCLKKQDYSNLCNDSNQTLKIKFFFKKFTKTSHVVMPFFTEYMMCYQTQSEWR